MTFAFTTPVSVVTRAVTGQDGYGNDTYADMTTALAGCVTWPRSSTETLDGRDTVITGLTLWAPAGAPITATSRVLVRGVQYEVDGEPGTYGPSPFTGTVAGVQVALKRVTG